MSGAGAKRAQDIGGAVLALVIGSYALSETPEMSQLGAVFPTTAAVVLIIAGLALGLRAVYRRPAAAVDETGGTEWLRFTGVVIVLMAWALLLKPLGFLLTCAVGMVLVGLITARERVPLTAIALHLLAGVGLLAGFYGLFRYVLKLSFP